MKPSGYRTLVGFDDFGLKTMGDGFAEFRRGGGGGGGRMAHDIFRELASW
jgi:hypothetical protein